MKFVVVEREGRQQAMSPSIGPVSGYQFLMCMCTATYAFTSLVGYQRWGARGYAPNDYCFSVLRYAAVRFLFYSLYVLGWHHALLGPAPYFLLSEGLPNYYFFSTTLQALLERLRELRASKESKSIGYLGNIVDLWEAFAKEEEMLVELGSDQTSLHNPFGGG